MWKNTRRWTISDQTPPPSRISRRLLSLMKFFRICLFFFVFNKWSCHEKQGTDGVRFSEWLEKQKHIDLSSSSSSLCPSDCTYVRQRTYSEYLALVVHPLERVLHRRSELGCDGGPPLRRREVQVDGAVRCHRVCSSIFFFFWQCQSLWHANLEPF